jgi:hypothetical protein
MRILGMVKDIDHMMIASHNELECRFETYLLHKFTIFQVHNIIQTHSSVLWD